MERLKTRTDRLRQLEETLLLKPGGMRVSDLSHQFKVNRRTIYRDLNFLAEQGVPLWQEHGIFRINRARYQMTVRLTYHESVALVLAGLLLSRTFDERNPHVISALRSLAVTLPEPFRAQLERAATRTQSQQANHRHTAVLEAIAEGWGTGHKVQISYGTPKDDALHERTIAPFFLEPTAAGVYVIGHDEASGEIRTFKLERVHAARVLPDLYSIPVDFDPIAYLEHSWQIMTSDQPTEVILRFIPDATTYVRERTWHTSQALDSDPEGGLTLRLCIAEPREMLPWIRSWGPQVEVIAPEWLRERVAEDLRRGAQIYDTNTKIPHVSEVR
jgi:predicted DNA-binding transcriptional regulator YafY